MVKKHALSAYLCLTLFVITSHIHASYLSPQKLSQKIHDVDYDFVQQTGLIEKITNKKTPEAIEATLNFAQDLYATHRANQRKSPEPQQHVEKRKKKLLTILLNNIRQNN